MGDAEANVRDLLEQVGLGDHAGALIELALPSIRLRGEAEASGEVLGRPPAVLWGLERGVTAIAGGGHRLALREDGNVAAWGYNERGQLGDGTTTYRRNPVAVRDLTDVTAVASGMGHSIAVTASGRVLAWGSNRNGQLGDGTQTDCHMPVAVEGLERDVIAIAAGNEVSLALTSNGSVFGWGLNPALEPGDAHAVPIRCPGLENVVAVAAGGSERLALTADGSVLGWGSSPSDLSGSGGVLGPARWGSAPRPVEGLPDAVRAISAGDHHSLALTASGAVFAWGQGHLEALGDGTAENRYPPILVEGLDAGVRAIAAGYGCSYALLESGAVVSWGWNQEGRLGDGSATKTPNNIATGRPAPGPVSALGGGVAAISEFVTLMDDGSVRAWGGGIPARRARGGRSARARRDKARRPPRPTRTLTLAHARRGPARFRRAGRSSSSGAARSHAAPAARRPAVVLLWRSCWPARSGFVRGCLQRAGNTADST